MLTETKMGMLKDGVIAPERIWAWAWQTVPMGQWGVTPSPSSVEYIRADLAAVQPAQPQPDPRDEVIARLVEALEFYADEDTYETQYERMPCDCCTDIFEPINDDKGSKARAALAAAKAVQHG